MPPRKLQNHSLEQAMATLINNQAAFVTLARESHEEMSLIRRKLEQIEAILLRHEQMLQTLPEAIRQKIGFKAR